MKRHRDLWRRMTSLPNLFHAVHKASRGKRKQPNVARFLFNLERQICSLQDELLAKTYTPGEYRTFEIYEPKRRMISAAPFRDRVVHHALCNVLEPIFERTFISLLQSWIGHAGQADTYRLRSRMICGTKFCRRGG